MLQLASAHGPLVLISQGILLDVQLPNVSEVSLKNPVPLALTVTLRQVLILLDPS